MPSETDLLNDALAQIGAARITSITDGSTNANYCQDLYAPLRDSWLRAHHWNFAMSRVELAQDAAAPAFEYAYQYTLPADCLKVVEYASSDPNTATTVVLLDRDQQVHPEFKIEGRKLLSNDGRVFIRYIKRETNPNIWDGMFYQGVAAHLASKLASAISRNVQLSQAKLQEANLFMSEAKAVDGQEGSVEPFIVDDLTAVR